MSLLFVCLLLSLSAGVKSASCSVYKIKVCSNAALKSNVNSEDNCGESDSNENRDNKP